jgi:hypothetical protein
MGWAEVIRLRVAGEMEERVAGEIATVLTGINPKGLSGQPGRPEAKLYRGTVKAGDLAVVILWDDWVKLTGSSELAQSLGLAIKQYGLVSTSRWFESYLTGSGQAL